MSTTRNTHSLSNFILVSSSAPPSLMGVEKVFWYKMCQIYCQFHWHTGNHYSTELLNMLDMFLFCTGSLNVVLVITDAGKGNTGVFFFFLQGCDIHSFISAWCWFWNVFSCPWEVSYIVFLYLVWSAENLRLPWAIWFNLSFQSRASESGYSILFLAVNISECKFRVVIYFKTEINIIFIFSWNFKIHTHISCWNRYIMLG